MPPKARSFLSAEAARYDATGEAQFREWFSLAKDLSSYLHERLDRGITLDTAQFSQVCAAALLTRGLSTYEGVILLARRGMRAEAVTLLRTLQEVMFQLGALRANRCIAFDILKTDIHYRTMALEKFVKSYESGALPPEVRKQVNEIRSQLKSDQHALEDAPRTPRKLSPEQFAREAGYEDQYLFVYQTACAAAHARLLETARHVLTGDAGKVQGFRFGPDYTDCEWLLVSSTDAFIKIVQDFSTAIGPLDAGWEDLVRLQNELLAKAAR